MHLDALQRWLTVVAGLAAALAALLYLARQAWRAFRLLERLASLVQYELSPNGGSSLRDDVSTIAQDVTAVAIALGRLQRDYSEAIRLGETTHSSLQLQLDGIVHELRQHHPRERGRHE